ncbi:hypothetical protein BCR42DRAFT_446158 [Absidia repens]|uniref:Uncharacterized protein n=1 Tax=Absidia repens TaxID=90262 RepID=A0A1X2IY31_9FUNG|nr:hypothetical protein BCR42DRAFT_446158 [Absidia repens]
MPALFPSSPPPSPSLPSSPPRRRSIPPLVLLSFAMLHSQVYWLYSVIYHLCHNLSDRPMDLSLDDTVLNALSKRSGRPRAFSEPQQTSCVMLQQHQVLNKSSSKIIRPRSTTISATTVSADAPLRRQQWVQQIQTCLDKQQKQHQQQQLLDTTVADERLGRTRPPRWWQRTRRHLTRQEKDHNIDPVSSNHIAPNLSSLSMELEGINSKQHHHLTPIRPASCDMQPHYHHDITATSTTSTMRKGETPIISTDDASSGTRPSFSNNLTSPSSSSSLSAQTAVTTCDNDHSAAIMTESSMSIQQQSSLQRQTPLAKIRSVFIKSQIEPENKGRSSVLNPKRKTMLGVVPSRWSAGLNNNDASTEHMKKRRSVRIKEPLGAILSHTSSSSSSSASTVAIESRPKRRLFSSLPAWHRKSVG